MRYRVGGNWPEVVVEAEYLATNAALAAAAGDWRGTLALDTEFQRTDTFFARPGLYQLASGGTVYLLDPLCIDDWSPLVEALEDPRHTVVMHSCSEDLELIYSHLGVQPRRLVDTQLAHAFLSETFSISYAGLVAHWCQLQISKAATRSNWLKRPLTAEQLHYAAEDVRHLESILAAMNEELASLGRADWCAAETAERLRYRAPEPERYYLGVKGASRLDARSLERLRALCSFREREAMRRDMPRNRVLRDDWLFALARARQLGDGLLREQLPAGAIKRYGDALYRLHAEPGQEVVAPELEAPPQPLTPGQSKTMQSLRAIATRVASELGFAPELLARKRDVEGYLREFLSTGALATLAANWRAPLLHDEFLSRLNADEIL